MPIMNRYFKYCLEGNVGIGVDAWKIVDLENGKWLKVLETYFKGVDVFDE